MKDRLIVVTGATGHLGINLIHALLAHGEKVRALVLPKDPLAYHLPSSVQQVVGSVTNDEDVDCLLTASEDLIVIHCAGIVSIAWRYQPLVHQVNVEGTKRVVDSCVKKGVKRFIYISSVHAIKEAKRGLIQSEVIDFDRTNVIGDYAKSKAEATAYVQAAFKKGLSGTIVFPSGMIGPFDYAKGSTTQTLLDAASKRLPMTISGGYDFVDVRDVATTIVKLIDVPQPAEGYLLTNQYYSIKELLSTVNKVQGFVPHTIHVPRWIAALALPFFALYYRLSHHKPTFTRYSLYTLKSPSLFSHQMATLQLDYHPRPLFNSIRDTIKWMDSESMIPTQRSSFRRAAFRKNTN